MRKLTAEKLLLLLVLLTILVLVFRGPLLETRLIIEPGADGFNAVLDSDVQDGGNTHTEWLDKDQLHWRCVLGQAYDYPFCGMQIYFSDTYLQGVNLSNYTHLNLSLEYQGSGHSLRVFMRNANPAYTRPNEIRSTKFNGIEVSTRAGTDYKDVRLEYFRVADWWLRLYELEMEHSQIEFTNVGLIEIQTGTGLKDGDHQFKLIKLELVGALISLESLYLGIILVWLCAILLYLASRIYGLTLAVRRGSAREAELTEINTLLDQRSRTLEEKSKLDPLTGAYNRAGIEDSLAQAFHGWKHEGKPLSLLMFDVDHFKQVNDTKGHALGDLVLRELTTLVSNNIRSDDRFARWGGEEFIIVCSNTELPKAVEMAEKLRRLIDNTLFAQSLNVTVSIGVAQIHAGENLELLFKRADEALYEAKREGRNQVKVSLAI